MRDYLTCLTSTELHCHALVLCRVCVVGEGKGALRWRDVVSDCVEARPAVRERARRSGWVAIKREVATLPNRLALPAEGRKGEGAIGLKGPYETKEW